MANKKKKPRKRPYVPPQRGDADAPPVPKKQEADRPERRERKAEVREQKQKELKRWQRRQTMRKVVVALVVLALIGGVTGFVLIRRAQEAAENRRILAAAEQAQKDAGCAPVETVEPYDPADQDATHVTNFPALDTYRSTPPTSGPHAGITFRAGVYDTPPDPVQQAIHSLEHGAVIIWYRPGADPDEIAKIADFVEANKDHTIMAPYDYPDEGKAGALPEGKDMALVAWHHMQLCDTPSQEVAAFFMSKYRSPTFNGGEYEGDAPEAGLTI